jgi:hypothetical protein
MEFLLESCAIIKSSRVIIINLYSKDRCNESRANLPSFSFLRERFVSLGKYLVGVEVFGWKDSELSPLRQDSFRRNLEGEGFLEPETGQLYWVRQPKGVEVREKIYCPGRSAALPVQRLRSSIFISLRIVFQFPLSLFFDASQAHGRRCFEDLW